MDASHSAVSTYNSISQIISILQALGIPTILGAIFGLSSSYFIFFVQSKREDKIDKRNTAKIILSQVYSYNVTAGTEKLFDINFPNATQEEKLASSIRFKDAAKEYNEMEALASLTVRQEASDILETIKTLVSEMQDEFRQIIQNGEQPKNRHELKKGQEFDSELEKLKNILKRWMR